MKRDIFDNGRKSQTGTTLLEALVGLVLMSIVGLGLSYAASRSLTSQRYLNTQNVVVTQARQWLLTKSSADIAAVCGSGGTGPSVTVGDKTAALDVTCETAGAAKAIVIGTTTPGRGKPDESEDPKGHELTVSIVDSSVRTKTVLSTPENNEAAKAIFGGDGKIEVSL